MSTIKVWGGIGLVLALIALVLNFFGISIPVTLGTKELNGWASVGALVILCPIALIIIGLIISAFSNNINHSR